MVGYLLWSGKRGSNPRPLAWEANALPTELLPQYAVLLCVASKRHCKDRRFPRMGQEITSIIFVGAQR